MSKVRATVVVLASSIGLATAACQTRSEERIKERGEEVERQVFGEDETAVEPQAGQEVGQAEPEGHAAEQQDGVIRRSIEPVAGEELGGTKQREGEADVQAQERVLQREIVTYNIPTVETCSAKADLNEVSTEHLAALGVPQQAAQQIVQHRESQGDFQSVSDLNNIQGLDQNVVTSLKEKVAVREKHKK